MTTALVPHASGFEIFGIKLFEDQAEIDADAVIADPQPYRLTFTSGATGEVDAAIRNASSLMADQATPASGAAGLVAKGKGDYRRITAALYEQGYYGGSVSVLIGGTEAAYLAPDVGLPDPVAVTVTVDPGPLFHFNCLVIANRAPFTSDPADWVEDPARLGFATGQVAKSIAILKAETLALNAWRQQGFAKADIASRDVVADHTSNTVDVTLTVNPGQRAAFGDVAVTGTVDMDPAFVRRQAGIQPGQEYDPDDLERARKRLDRLEVFRALRIDAAENINTDGLLPMTIFVEEQALRRFGVGATYSTIDGFGVEAFHLWRNLFGQAERLRLDARIAGIGFPVNTAEFDYMFGGTFTKPGFLTPDTDLVAAVAAERSVLDNYTETSASTRLGLTHFLSDEMTLDGGLAYERSRFDDDFGTRDFSILGAYGALTFDNRDDENNATEGFFAEVTAEPFYEFYYGNPAFRTTAELRAYFSPMEDDFLILAGRVKAGALLGPDLDEIPPDRLFFAGGGGSVRGYGFKSIGVDNPDGTTTGGRYLLEGSVEARFKVTNDIGAVAFVDAGYVAADSFPSIDQMRVGAGVGLRYFTGLGPLRLDLAFPLNKREGDPDYAIYLGIGQAF